MTIDKLQKSIAAYYSKIGVEYPEVVARDLLADFIESASRMGIASPKELYLKLYKKDYDGHSWWRSNVRSLIRSGCRNELEEYLTQDFNNVGMASGRLFEIIGHFPSLKESPYAQNIRAGELNGII